MKKLLLILMLSPLGLLAQNFQSWSTVNIKGKLSDDFTIALEPESRYSDKMEYFHLDLGVVYTVNDKLKVGGYFREIFEIKNDERVHEMRPHLDFFYKFNGNFKVRVRNEYQIKESSDNLYRIRVRPTFTYKVNDWFIPFVQTEPFFTLKDGIIRNRFNIGPGFKYNKLWVKPGYMLQTNYKDNTFSNLHILWVNMGFKF
jgi:hypothetical protein